MKLRNTMLASAIALTLGCSSLVVAMEPQAAAEFPADGLPLVEQVADGVFVTPPAVYNLTVLIVRVYNSSGEQILHVRSQGEPVELLAADLPAGEYYYQIKTLLLLNSPDALGEPQEISQTQTGEFVIREQQLEPLVPVASDQQAGLLEALQHTALQIAGQIAGLLVAPVHAGSNVVTASSTEPSVFFNDTDWTGVASEWKIYTPQFGGASSPPAYSIYDNINNTRVMRINSSNDNSLSLQIFGPNSSSRPDGAMILADGAVFIDRVTQRVAIGGEEAPSSLNLWSGIPDIRFLDESDNSWAHLRLAADVFQLWVTETSTSPVDWPFEVNVNAPDNSLRIRNDGSIRMGSGFFYNAAAGTLHLGDAANSSPTTRTLQLSSANAPEIYFLEPGNRGMEMQVVGNGWRLNADTNGDGVINTSGVMSLSTDAPAGSLVVNPQGDLLLGDNFYYAATGKLNLGDAVNSTNSGSNTLQLTSNNAPDLYFLDPGDTGMELELIGGRLRFNGDPDGSGQPNGPNYSIFSIHASAPTYSLRIAANGNIGAGVFLPAESLHLRGEGGSTQLRVEEATATAAARALLVLRNNGATGLQLEDTSTANVWHLDNSSAGLSLSLESSGVVDLQLQDNGNLNIAGTLTVMSDRNAKTAIEPVDAQAILDRVTALPVGRWEYKNAPGETHIGPLAQDFHADFQVGATNTGIAVMDAAGVVLAAIQALAATDQRIAAGQGQLEQACGRLPQLYQQQDAEIARLKVAIKAQQEQVRQLLAGMDPQLQRTSLESVK